MLVSLRVTTDQTIPLGIDLLLDWPFVQGTYAAYSGFFTHLEEVFGTVAHGPSTFILSDGVLGHHRLRILAFLVGCGIWAFRQDQITTRMVAVNGAAYLISVLCIAAHGTR